MQNLFDESEMAAVLAELNEKNKNVDIEIPEEMSEEMKASAKRVQDILEKHAEE